MRVSAPASSANLGPGFDCLGLALELPFLLVVGGDGEPGELLDAEPTHPAAVAFVDAGGDPGARLRWRSPIPPGRGLGFSGAARVAGAYAARRIAGVPATGARLEALAVAADLEGHPDNAAPSALGGFTVTAGGRTLRLDPPPGVAVAVWSPEQSTSTDASRRTLPAGLSLADATDSIGRAALWVAAVAAGDLAALRDACADRLHQPSRLAARPDAAATLDELLADPRVLAAWLSGSGPSVAALVPAGGGGAGEWEPPVLPPGRVRVVEIAVAGVREID